MPIIREPSIIEMTPRGEYVSSVWSRLMKDNVIFLGTPIDDDVANLIIAQLLYLESESAEKDIAIYINSPGGSVTSGLAIYDTMKYIKPEISTICVGQAASMAALLMAAGTKGKRAALPNSRVMIHQPMAGTQGQVSDIVIMTEEFTRTKKRLNDLLVHHTGQPLDKIELDTDRNCFMSADESVEYGLIDKVYGVDNDEDSK